MWRSLHLIAPKSTFPQGAKLPRCFYATKSPSGRAKRSLISIVSVAGISAGATIVYAKYDPKFRKIIEDNVPYSESVFKSIPDLQSEPFVITKTEVVPSEKAKEVDIESSLLKKSQERLTKEEKPQAADFASQVSMDQHVESSIKKLISEMEFCTKQSIRAGEGAAEAITLPAVNLFQALADPEGMHNEIIWKEINHAVTEETKQRNLANEKLAQAKSLAEKLKAEIQKFGKSDDVLVKSSVDALNKAEEQWKQVEEKLSITADDTSKMATKHKDLVQKSRNQFKSELEIALPKYVHKQNGESITTENELHQLIARAHRRIEDLQKELAKFQVTEQLRIEAARMMQKEEDKQFLDAKVEEEVTEKQKILEAQFQQKLDTLRDQFETDMRKHLCRQAAANAEHLHETLFAQRQEMTRRQNMVLEEQLLQQKGIFTSQISESMEKLGGIEQYLKTRVELDESIEEVRALWLACYAMKNTIHSGFSELPKSLGKELAVVKAAAGEGSSFVNTVLAGIPSQAIQRGVYTDENLKQRFGRVKKICRRVAMVDGSNRSLFCYALSYLQSFFIIEVENIPKEEMDVDPLQLDTFDILNRMSYFLQRNDLTKALYYANNLKGEPLNVATDWISEVKLLLETSQAINCLITYAAAIDVQANH